MRSRVAPAQPGLPTRSWTASGTSGYLTWRHWLEPDGTSAWQGLHQAPPGTFQNSSECPGPLWAPRRYVWKSPKAQKGEDRIAEAERWKREMTTSFLLLDGPGYFHAQAMHAPPTPRHFNSLWPLINSVNCHNTYYQECFRCFSKCVPSLCFSPRPHHKITLLWVRYSQAFGFFFC